MTKACLFALFLPLGALAAENTTEVPEKPPVQEAEIAVEPPVPQSIEERAKADSGLVEQRVNREKSTTENPFVITPHQPNYLLPAYYNSNIDASSYAGELAEGEKLDSMEVKFQVSLKFPLAMNLFGGNNSLWVAYTQQSFWQAYNSGLSSPFRETNYEPEAFMAFDVSDDWFGIKPKFVTLGVVHQSNGRSDPYSRSWNRIYANFVFETDNAVFQIKPWYRIHESREDDNNPNIERYLGYGEFTGVYVMGDYSLDFMLRNNLRSDNKGAMQLGFTFPLWGKLRGYVQYFNGYGESLIDYNHTTQSIGLGIMLTNWL
ncbi:phospholipase A [Gallaecimonas xiamenensis]|uniref:Phospholipase A1 n=1 Tax=Gallaecimonas xiamenensis 3-C-1 TaxID=745411 RepID=K2J9X4_9GAMM|nr:phospholipase A [Gallaecimonas xiamenensis]EKE67289.1 phospholipase A(1) [Gallaecimonas xiamenensis 3-C-1]